MTICITIYLVLVLVGAFEPRFEYLDNEFIAKIPELRRNFLFLQDVRQHFRGDPEGLKCFLVDVVAVHTPEGDYPRIKTTILFLKSILRLIDDMRTDVSKSQGNLINEHVTDVLTRFSGGQGLSIRALTSLVSALGIPIGAQPGRHPSDYSREYEWKSQYSWTEVARKSIVENPDIRAEFNGRSFESLNFQEKENLKHRIREGVKSYAERLNKPFPIPTTKEEGGTEN